MDKRQNDDKCDSAVHNIPMIMTKNTHMSTKKHKQNQRIQIGFLDIKLNVMLWYTMGYTMECDCIEANNTTTQTFTTHIIVYYIHILPALLTYLFLLISNISHLMKANLVFSY